MELFKVGLVLAHADHHHLLLSPHVRTIGIADARLSLERWLELPEGSISHTAIKTPFVIPETPQRFRCGFRSLHSLLTGEGGP